jgi:hypothetical protein
VPTANLLTLTFKHCGSAGNGRIDRWEPFLGEGHTSLGRGQQARAHLRERCEPVVDDPEEVVEARYCPYWLPLACAKRGRAG